jgi:hypothetical protein
MAWQFETWKTLRGTGGKTAAILIIAGSIGLLSKPWFQRDPAHYFTMRDEAEIVGRCGEQELAMISTVEEAYTPPAMSGYWHGSFASTNGTFTTNSLDRYAQNGLWEGLEALQDFHFNLSPAAAWSRRWVDLWVEGGVEAYDQAAPFDPLNRDGAYDEARYAMNEDWWKTNVFDGEDWYPFTNRNYVTAIDVTKGALRAVGRAYTSARWTIDGGDTGAFANTNFYTYANVVWEASATNSRATPFYYIAQDAWDSLQASEPMQFGEPPGVDPINGIGLADALPQFRVYYHYVWYRRYESPIYESDGYRRVTLREYVSSDICAGVTIGTNCTVYGIGARIAPDLYAGGYEIYHNETGSSLMPYLIAQQCEPPQEVLRGYLGNIVSNAWLHVNPVSAWDGRFAQAPFLLYANYPFPAATNTAVADDIYFGWQSVTTNQAFLIDWRFSHLTNREAFFP